MTQEYVLFEEPYPVKRKVPFRTQMKSIDKKLPPVGVLERGAEAVRYYWNLKNLRRRKH